MNKRRKWSFAKYIGGNGSTRISCLFWQLKPGANKHIKEQLAKLLPNASIKASLHVESKMKKKFKEQLCSSV